ncbi:putative ribonuclease H-like domain-containing protein [Tanacetum coccineum]|uniref:Ribonuclease H-like domain-containing protein n=1 Tax=Tanacetum coccineum TaxID=301880 RepID=A0ABQ5FEC0_9ASTR
MLSLRINRFEKKAGRKMNYNNQQPARFDRRKVRCYKCLQLGHFARECNVKTVDDKARYSAFKVTEVKTDEPKALVSVDSMVNWSDHAAENKTGEVEKVYGMMAGLHADNGGADASEAAAEFAMMGISPKAYQNAVKTLESQKDWYHKTQIALEDKIRVLSANLENTANTLSYTEKLHDQAQKEKKEWEVKTKIGLGFKEYFGKDEVFDLSTPSVFYPEPVEEDKPLYSWFVKAGEMHAVPPSITGTYMPTPYKSDIEETQPQDLDQDFPPALNQDFAQSQMLKSQTPTAGNLVFLDSVPCKSKAASVPAGSRNSPASVTAGGSDPAASRNRPAVNSADRPNPAGWSKRPATVSAGRPVSAGWLNPAARPYFRPSSVYNMYWPDLYDPMYMNKGRWGTAVKTSAGSSQNWLGSLKCTNGVVIKGGIVKFGGGRMVEYQEKALYRLQSLTLKMSTMLKSCSTLTCGTQEFWEHDLYTFHISDLQPEQKVTCLVAKASLDESTRWHRRMAHVNFKTINKLAKDGLVEGFNSQEFKNAKLIELYGEKGIKRDYSNPRTPQQNGVAERKNRTLIEAARTMFLVGYAPNARTIGTQETKVDAGTQDHDSDSEVDEQVIVVPSFPSNSFASPSRGIRNGPSVMDAAARYGYLFSQATAEILCQAEAEIRNQGVSAVRDPAGIDSAVRDPAGIDSAGGVSAGSPSAGSDPAGGNPADSFQPAGSFEPADESNPAVSSSVSADFIPVYADESTLPPGQSLGSSANTTRFPLPSDVCMDQLSSGIFTSSSYDDDFSATLTNVAPVVDVNQVPTRRVNTIHPQSQILGDLASPVLTRSRAQKSKFGESAFIGYIQDQQRTNHTDQLHCLFGCFLSQLEPTSIAKALEDPDWVAAMQEEMQQFINQQVWKLVPLPDGKHAIGTKWILKNKRDARGIVVRNKARLVAQGHRQEEGIDYDEVFAPVARIEAIRLFLAFASYMGFLVYQLDVKSAFLYGEIEEEVYVTQPKGFEDPYFPKHVYRVVKALYGLHQAPRAWYARLSTFLLQHNYRRGTIDKTLFIKKDSRDILLVQVYVDDIIFGSTNKAWCDDFEVLMKGEFEMSAMGEMTFFLGLQVKQLPDGLFISQDKYVKDMLTKFDMESVRTATTPYEAAKTKLKDETDPPVNVHLYLTASRPDIMFAVSACSRHQVTPLTSHLNAVKKIFKYLKGQPKLGLWYPKDSPFQLEAYSDSDYAGSHGDRKSTTGGCQFLGRRLISWQCKKQTIVATSSTEAEYVAAASCCAQVLWIQNQLLDYGFNFMNTKIFIDNQSTICIVKNPVFHQRTKHIEIRHHFIRDANEKNLIQVLKIHTDDNVADLLTKAFDGPRFAYLVVHIGMMDMMLVSAGCTMVLLVVILPAERMVSAGWSMVLLVVIFPAGRLVSAGCTMVLLVVIFPAGRLVSAGCTMVLLVVIFPAGRLVSAGCTMVLLEVTVPAGFFVPAGSYGLCCCNTKWRHSQYKDDNKQNRYLGRERATVRPNDAGSYDLVATIDGREVVVTESLIRAQLQLDDANGIFDMQIDDIFAGMGAIGYPPGRTLTFLKHHFSPQWRFLVHTILHCLSPKAGSWNQFPSSIATALICLSTGRVYNFSRFILEGMIANVKTKKNKFLMYPRFLQMLVAIETADRTPRPTSAFTRKLFSNMRLKWAGEEIPLTPPMLAIAAAGDAADEDNAAAHEAAGSTAEAHPAPHSPPFSPVRESTPERQPETEWVVPNPVSPGTDWRPWPSVPAHSPIRDHTNEPASPPTPPDQTVVFEVPLEFGPVPRPAGYVDPATSDPIIFGPQPRPYDFVDPALEEPVIFGPPPRPDNYIEPEDITNLNSMEDDTILGGFHEETHAGPADAPTPTADAAGRAEDPVLLTSLSAKIDRLKKLERTVKQLRIVRLVGDAPATEGDVDIQDDVDLEGLSRMASEALGHDQAAVPSEDMEECEEEEVPLRRKRSVYR